MRRTNKLALRTQTVRVLSSQSLSLVAGGAVIKRCTGLDSGCAATLTDTCRTDFCSPTEECTGECYSLVGCDNSIELCA